MDPITVEVIRNRLTHIGRLAGMVLIRTATSPIAVESKDLGFNIADHQGRSIVYSVWMPRHGTTLHYMIESCRNRFGANIRPGDMYLTNDPHAGSLHVSDLAVLAPVFWEGEIAAWVGCATHHLDMGGMTAGWCPLATDSYQEGLKFPPVKLIREGHFVEDIFNIYLINVRVPDMQGYDLKAQIAANNFAIEEIKKLIAHYGLPKLKEAYEDIINFTEEKTRARIKLIPDGSYYYEDYLDYDKIYRIACTLTVTGERMVFDFTGTSPQSHTSVNAALACAVANLHNIACIMLFPDIPANEGLFRPIEVKLPPGTLLSCQSPAPCSGASVQGGWKAQTVTMGVLTEALAHTDQWWRGTAGWGSGLAQTQLTGVNQKGRRYSVVTGESAMQGGGARATKDGVGACNIAGSTTTSIPNIETIEQRYPLLYLWRGYLQNSGGAGQYQGGMGGITALTPHCTDNLEVLAFHIGEVIPALPRLGGYPGDTVHMDLLHQADIEGLLNGKMEYNPHLLVQDAEHLGPSNAPLRLVPNDLLIVSCPGGAGWGDPLLRAVDMVAKDIATGSVSSEKAFRVYGAVIDKEKHNLIAADTETRRGEIRRERLGKWQSSAGMVVSADHCASLFWNNGCYQPACVYCKRDLIGTELKVVQLEDVEMGVFLNRCEQVTFWGYLCPACGTLLDVRVKVQI